MQLAQLIIDQTSVVDQNIRDNGLVQPSFEPDSGVPAQLTPQATPKVEKAKNDVIEATIELRQLLEGPMKLLLPEVSPLFHNLSQALSFLLGGF